MGLLAGFCQSCGMPLSKDAHGGGWEVNGKKSELYCSHCYQSGRFTEPHLTAVEMVEKVRLKMKEMKVPFIARWLFTKAIPRLQRWRK